MLATPPPRFQAPPLTASVPPSMIVPPKLALPESVSVPAPTFTSEPPTPSIIPLTSVERLLEPTVSSLEPRSYVPAPAIEPAVVPVMLGSGGPPVSGKVPGREKWLMPPALAMNVALPPLLLPKRLVTPPALVVIVALPALLPWKKFVFPLLVMLALPAVAVPPRKNQVRNSVQRIG